MHKKLLIISSVWVEPNSSAAGNRVLQLISLFQEDNFEVHYASTASSSDFSIDLSEFNCVSHNVEVNNSSFDTFIVAIKPTVVLFDRFIIEEQFGWRVVKHCPEALRILDTEDLHCLRLAREECVKKKLEFSFDILKDFEITKREIASIYRCDLSIIISEFEMNLLVEHFAIPEKMLIYLPLFGKRTTNIVTYEDRNDFVFIGNFLHSPNHDAVEELHKSIWSTIYKKNPSAKLYIYGAYCPQKIISLTNINTNFIVKGRAENAIEVISKAKILLVPLRFGAGIKGKLIEAMQVGTPSITTSVGAEGITYSNKWNGYIEDNFIEFSEKAIHLYNDKNLWHKCQTAGFEILEQKFNIDLYKLDFIKGINVVLNNLKQHRKINFISSILNQNSINSYYYMSKWIEEKNKKLQ